MVRSSCNLTGDSRLFSHIVEFFRTLGEHFGPHDRKDFTLLSLWVVKVSGNNLAPDSDHGRNIVLILLVEELTIVFVQNLNRCLIMSGV